MTSGDDAVPAEWIHEPELLYHLAYKPYLKLDVKFDAAAMLQEAIALKDWFVSHRSYDRTNQDKAEWKSLGIQALHGDYTKTSYHTHYGVTKNPDYRLTEVAERCPKTLAFLRQITDLSQCERVRFMLLEPGAKIAVHSDAPGQETCLAVNISLNMPRGCVFYADVAPDGSHTPYTVQLPFDDDGSVIIFNNACYHYVENNSTQDRIHIIFHGPLRFSQEHMLRLARLQNGIHDRKSLVQALIHKKCLMGMPVDPGSQLFREWKAMGITPDALPESVELIVVEEPLTDEQLRQECLYKITRASLFPLKHTVIAAGSLDDYLKTLQGKEFAIIINAGTLIDDVNLLVIECLKTIGEMRKKQVMVCGHIIDYPGKENIPYLHEQFAILDLAKWRQLSAPPFGKRYGNQTITFPGYKTSGENFHDDYTPTWIAPDAEATPKTGKAGWGSALMAFSLKKGIPVINVPQELRNIKRYAYPGAENTSMYKGVKKSIEEKLDYARKQVFFFNNERLTVTRFENWQPQRLISVAAGFKPFGLLHQFWNQSQPDEIFIIDYNPKALAYIRELITCTSMEKIEKFIHAFMRKHPYGPVLDRDSIRKELASIVKNYFNNDERNLLRAFEKMNNARFIHCDFIHEPGKIVQLFETGIKTLFWHSNAWQCNSIYYLLTPAEIDANYLQFMNMISEKLHQQAFRLQNSYETFFGESIHQVHSFATDGSEHKGIPPEHLWLPVSMEAFIK